LGAIWTTDVDDLRQFFEELPDLEPETTWDRHRLAFRDHVAENDIDDFLNWSTTQATMFVGEAPYIKMEYDTLAGEADFWEKAIQEPGIGNPPRLSYAPYTSGNYVHQAYHLKQWLDWSGRKVSELESVYEIGAGYGTMAVILRRLGFEGPYATFDLPELDLLRGWYLSRLGVKGEEAVDDPDLLIALYSVSEMPLEEREVVKANSYLIGYQAHWDGIDNHRYFDWLTSEHDHVTWFKYSSETYNNHWYLIGTQ